MSTHVKEDPVNTHGETKREKEREGGGGRGREGEGGGGRGREGGREGGRQGGTCRRSCCLKALCRALSGLGPTFGVPAHPDLGIGPAQALGCFGTSFGVANV